MPFFRFSRKTHPFNFHLFFWTWLRSAGSTNNGVEASIDEYRRFVPTDRRDGAENERTLPGPRDAGEDGESPLRDLDADVFEVVLSGALHPDQIVGVGGMLCRQRGLLGGSAHRWLSKCRG